MLDRFFLSADVSPGNIMSLDLSLVINGLIHGFNIILLIGLLSYLLYKPVKKFMAERTQRIQNDIDSARANNEQSLAIKANYQKLTDDIDKEREEVLNRARRRADEAHDQILAKAHTAAEDLKEKAINEIGVERANAADEIRRMIIETSVLVATRFVKEFSVDQETQDRYIDEALAEWSEKKYELD